MVGPHTVTGCDHPVIRVPCNARRAAAPVAAMILFLATGMAFTSDPPSALSARSEAYWAAFGPWLAPTGLFVADVDADGSLEAVAVAQTRVLSLNAADGQVEWQNEDLPGTSIPYLRIADVDGDLLPEVVVAIPSTNNPDHDNVLVLAGEDGSTQLVVAVPRLGALETCDRDGDGIAEIVLATTDGKLQTINPDTGAIVAEADLGTGRIDALRILEVAGYDGLVDVVAADDRLYLFDTATLQPLLTTEPLNVEGVGQYDSILAEDIDGDGLTEVAVNFYVGFRVLELRNLIFEDGFESGNTSAWSDTTP